MSYYCYHPMQLASSDYCISQYIKYPQEVLDFLDKGKRYTLAKGDSVKRIKVPHFFVATVYSVGGGPNEVLNITGPNGFRHKVRVVPGQAMNYYVSKTAPGVYMFDFEWDPTSNSYAVIDVW